MADRLAVLSAPWSWAFLETGTTAAHHTLQNWARLAGGPILCCESHPGQALALNALCLAPVLGVPGIKGTTCMCRHTLPLLLFILPFPALFFFLPRIAVSLAGPYNWPRCQEAPPSFTAYKCISPVYIQRDMKESSHVFWQPLPIPELWPAMTPSCLPFQPQFHNSHIF